MIYHTLFLLKIRKDVAKFVVCCIRDWCFKGYVVFITSLWEQMTPEHGQFRPKGHDWQDICMGQLDIAKYRSCGSHGFRDNLLKFFHIISLWKLMTHEAWTNGPQGHVGRIYAWDC